MLPRLVKPLFAAMPTLLALNLIGCAAPSVSPPVAIQCPAPPPIPTTNTPLPKQSYSLSAQQLLQSWRERLTDTPATSKP